MDIATIINATGVLLSASAVIVSVWSLNRQISLTGQIHNEQQTLSKRQFFIQIWPQLADLSEIDPNNTVVPDLIKAINTLELVAVSCEGQFLDIDIIRRTFRTKYLQFCDTIRIVPKQASLGKSGADLLLDNPAIEKLYAQLKDEHQNQNQIRPIS